MSTTIALTRIIPAHLSDAQRADRLRLDAEHDATMAAIDAEELVAEAACIEPAKAVERAWAHGAHAIDPAVQARYDEADRAVDRLRGRRAGLMDRYRDAIRWLGGTLEEAEAARLDRTPGER